LSENRFCQILAGSGEVIVIGQYVCGCLGGNWSWSWTGTDLS